MIDALKYIAEHATEHRFFFDSGEEFSITIGDFVFCLLLDENPDELEPYSYPDNIETVAEAIKTYGLANVQIRFIEELSSRKDSIWEGEDDKKIYYDWLPASVRNAIMQIVRQLNQINAAMITSYSFGVYDPSEGFCDVDGNYAGYISINPTLFNLGTVKTVIATLKDFKSIDIPCNYCVSFLREDKFRNIFKPQFVNTNTKARRLGYLKTFFKFIAEKQKVAEAFLNKRFEEYALPFGQQLADALNDKGLVILSGGKSAEPYISLLKEFELITVVNRAVIPTKWLRTQLALIGERPEQSENIFRLNELDRLFFLEILLRKDFLYFSLILELIFVSGESSYQLLLQQFQPALLSKLKTLERENYYGGARSSEDLRTITRRVNEWKNPRVYLEHVLMPRLNWMLDLGLISMVNLQVKTTAEGERLLRELNFWGDVSCGAIADSVDYLDRYYPLVFAGTYWNNYGEFSEREVIVDEVKANIEKSFNLFRTLAPNRVTSSQAFTYSKYILLLDKHRTISGKTHERILESELKDTFVYKYQPQYEDGYIQKINP